MKRVMIAAATLSVCAGADAQVGPALQPGELIHNGGSQQLKVLRCRATAYRWRECEAVVWKDGRPDSNPAWWNEEDLVKGDARTREALALPPRKGPAAVQASRPDPTPPARPRTNAPRPATTQRIPDGTYRCQMWMGGSYVSLGTVRSTNGSLDTGLLRKVGATVTGATPSANGVTISYTTARGYRESMDCTRL